MTQFTASRTLTSDATMTDALDFVITKRIREIRTITLARIKSVSADGKTMSVESLIMSVNNAKNAVTPPTIFNVPCGTMRGGNAGLITKFKTGDTVIVGIIDRQADAVKRTGTQQAPVLLRTHALEDAMILSHWGKNEPEIFIKITDDGIVIQGKNTPIEIETSGDITINSANKVTINTDVTINGDLSINGSIATTGSINATGNVSAGTTSLKTHVHSGVQTGTSVTGLPQ